MRGVHRVDVLGCPFDAISFEETVEAVRTAVREGKRLQVVPGNVDFVMKARRDPGFAARLRGADLVVADGVPIVWAASLLGDPIRGRVSGTDLVWRCAEISAETGAPVALIGAGPGIADEAARRMESRYPGARARALPTPWDLDARKSAELAGRVRALGAGIVLVALGAPRQEEWVRAHLDATGAAVGIGIGSAFDIISGAKPRAPRWMRDHGLEWLHRMTQEPRRLGRRYLVEDSPFVWHLARSVARRRLGVAG